MMTGKNWMRALVSVIAGWAIMTGSIAAQSPVVETPAEGARERLDEEDRPDRPPPPRRGDPKRDGERPPGPDGFRGPRPDDGPRPGPGPGSGPGPGFMPRDGRGDRPDRPGFPGFGRPMEGEDGSRRAEHHLEELRRIDPEMYELEKRDRDLEKQCADTAQRLRRAAPSDRDDIKKQLMAFVEQHFDARQARRELQLKRLESELEKMRDSLQKRNELRAQIVTRRVGELAGDADDLDF